MRPERAAQRAAHQAHADDGAEVRAAEAVAHHRRNEGSGGRVAHAEQHRVIQSDDEKADGVKHAVADRDEHLPAKERHDVFVDGTDDEHGFVFEFGILHGQIIAPRFVETFTTLAIADALRKAKPR